MLSSRPFLDARSAAKSISKLLPKDIQKVTRKVDELVRSAVSGEEHAQVCLCACVSLSLSLSLSRVCVFRVHNTSIDFVYTIPRSHPLSHTAVFVAGALLPVINKC